MIYLTYNDLPSGIYSGQVIDVCRFFRDDLKKEIRLVALVSIRKYFSVRKKIRSELSGAIVLPMFPLVGNWKINAITLRLLFIFIGRQSVIARGPFAASLALSLKKSNFVKSVCFDARGAYDAEFTEYNVAENEKLRKEIFFIEKNAVLSSDYRIAVSEKLVIYWKEKFGYKETRHAVIPCTLNSGFVQRTLRAEDVAAKRKSMGYVEQEVVFVYSGTSSGWQSLQFADDLLMEQLKKNKNARALFLTSPDVALKSRKEFPERVVVRWVGQEQVFGILSSCDYGLLVRENSVTNSVSSPVKFAEYLSAGLKVIISENIGDFSAFVKKNNCGYITGGQLQNENMMRPAWSEKEQSRKLALDNFRKEKYRSSYAGILEYVS